MFGRTPAGNEVARGVNDQLPTDILEVVQGPRVCKTPQQLISIPTVWARALLCSILSPRSLSRLLDLGTTQPRRRCEHAENAVGWFLLTERRRGPRPALTSGARNSNRSALAWKGEPCSSPGIWSACPAPYSIWHEAVHHHSLRTRPTSVVG